MSRVFCGTAVLWLAFATLAVAQSDPPREWTPELTLRFQRIGSVQVSPDGTLVAFTVRQAVLDDDQSEYRTHIHLGRTDRTGGRQLTQGDKSCDDPQWSPDSRWIAFVSNRVGKKNLWLISPNGGEAVQLTDVPTDISSFKWSPDGKSIAFTALEAKSPEEESKARQKDDARVVDANVKLSRLFVVPLGSPPALQENPRQLTTGTLCVATDSGRKAAFDWSPDGLKIAFSHVRTPSPDDWPSADLSVVELAGGTVKPLATTAVAESSPLFSPDGQTIVFTSSGNPPSWGGQRTIQIVPSAGGSPRALAVTKDGFGRYSELVGWSVDGKQIYFTEVQGTVFKLLAMPLAGSPVEISRDSGMSSSGVTLNLRGTHFGFSWETLDRPPEAFASAVSRFEPNAVSRVNGDVPLPTLGKTEVARWKSTDGMEIEGLVTYPVNYEKGKRYPLLLVIHGGPMGVFTQSFDGTAGTYPVAAFAAKGYAVLRANPRGSSGYGAKFRHANYGDWGGGDFQDLMTGVDHLIAQGVADESRMGVMGWSYGGFMTSWTITQTKRFKAASVGAGVTNLMSFTGTADIPGFLPDYFGGEFWDKLDVYRNHSAMFQVKGVTTPTLIQHGERDERVPLSQGQELYNALKRQGCVTTMVTYPRTPHGIEEPRLLLDCMQRNVEWFDRYVGSSTQGGK